MMQHYFHIFNGVFTNEHRTKLSQKAQGYNPSPDTKLIDRLLNDPDEHYEAWRIHLSAWLEFAADHDGLDADRKARLRETKDWRAWNQVLNELRIPYLLERVFGLKVNYTRAEVGRRTADVEVACGGTTLYIEIKTPGKEPAFPPEGARMLGADTAAISQALESANKQFLKGACNILALGAHLMEASPFRWDVFLTNALYGQEIITCTLDSRTGRPLDQPHTEFRPDGRLQHNRFTRVSAVLVFNDSGTDRVRAGRTYECAVYHNTFYAVQPLPLDIFRGAKQFLFDEHGRGKYIEQEGGMFTFRGY